jgi:hypothetical protein
MSANCNKIQIGNTSYTRVLLEGKVTHDQVDISSSRNELPTSKVIFPSNSSKLVQSCSRSPETLGIASLFKLSVARNQHLPHGK